jgi:hypothetical protein
MADLLERRCGCAFDLPRCREALSALTYQQASRTLQAINFSEKNE